MDNSVAIKVLQTHLLHIKNRLVQDPNSQYYRGQETALVDAIHALGGPITNHEDKSSEIDQERIKA